MSASAKPLPAKPLPDLQNALDQLDAVASYHERKMARRLKRLSVPPVRSEGEEFDQEEMPTAPTGRLTIPSLQAGSEELQPRLRHA